MVGMPNLRVFVRLSLVLVVFIAGPGHQPGPVAFANDDDTRPTCAEHWKASGLDDNPFAYDFERDPEIRPGQESTSPINGNFGYTRYEHRVTQTLMNQLGLSETEAKRNACLKELTVLVYMAGDNDLSPYAFWDLNEMESPYKGARGASQLYLDLVVQADTYGDNGIRRYHIFQTPGTGRDYVRDVYNKRSLGLDQFKENWDFDKVKSPVVEELPERVEGQDHKERFYDFLRWGITKYPSKHYMVIFWGHGQGWASDPDSITPPKRAQNNSEVSGIGRIGGLGFDDKGQFLNLHQLYVVLADIQKNVLHRSIDIFASDACLMQSLEVAYELSDVTDYIVGSSQIQTFLGFPYRTLIKRFNDQLYAHHHNGRYPYSNEVSREFTGANPLNRTCGDNLICRLAVEVPERVRSSAGTPNAGFISLFDPEASKSYTVSTLSSHELRWQLGPALNNLGKELATYLDVNKFGDRTAILKIARSIPNYLGGAKSLYQFLSRLENHLYNVSRQTPFDGYTTGDGARVLNALRSINGSTLSQAVLNYHYGSYYKEKYGLGFFKGFSFWLPDSLRDYYKRIEDFQRSAFYQDHPDWGRALLQLYQPILD